MAEETRPQPGQDPRTELRGHTPLLALAGVLILAAALRLVALDQEGYGNTYYAAAVKSTLTGWRSFFFVSFDPAGFVSVDKPPLGLWVQAISAGLLGFNGVSLLLPQALARIASVALVYWLVRRAFGRIAGLLVAAMPITVVTDRNNTMDSQLVFVLLLGLWAASLAAESGKLRWLLAAGALGGLAYNIKMLQAYPVLPAFALAYLLFAPLSRRDRAAHVTAMGLVLLLTSLSWSAIVDLAPAAERPYVGSSGTNSALSPALGYNGLGRLLDAVAAQVPVLQIGSLSLDLTVQPGFAPGIGTPGPLRLLQDGLASQASWLLPLAVLGLVIAGGQAAARHDPDRLPFGDDSDTVPDQPGRLSRRRQRVALVLWGGWLLAWGLYFSVARFYHVYYLVMLGPAIAALTGIGIGALWRTYRGDGRIGWLLAHEWYWEAP